jgi:hypothetical protein
VSLILLLNCELDSNLELYKEFAEEALSIALHPSGLYVLVGFSDKLRLMNLLIDDIRTFREFSVRGCREVGCCFESVRRVDYRLLTVSELRQVNSLASILVFREVCHAVSQSFVC